MNSNTLPETQQAIKPQQTLRQNYERTKQLKAEEAKPIVQDPALRWVGLFVSVQFLSGRELVGKLARMGRYDFDIEDAAGAVYLIQKHAVERIWRAVRP